MIKGPVFIIVIFMLLNLFFNFSLSSIAITSAVVTGAVAFAFKETLVNLIGGIAISIEKPFKIGDWIKVKNDIIGEVIQTSWRTTRLLTPTSDLYVIPNQVISNSEFFNFHMPDKVHGEILKVGVSYDHPPNKVKEVILDVLKGIRGIADTPAFYILLVNYNDFTIDYEIRYWITDFAFILLIRDEVFSKIWYAFKRENIRIPFPIRTIEYAKDKKEYKDELSLEIFKNCPLFENTEDNILLEVSRQFERVDYGKDEIVVKYNSEGDALYIVEKGELQVTSRDKFGKQKRVTEISAGEIFGEMSIITGSKTMVDVSAQTDCTLLRLKRERLKELTQEYPKLRVSLVSFADKRLEQMLANESTEQIVEVESPAAKKKLLEKFFKYFSE